jgi:hypothetical protein
MVDRSIVRMQVRHEIFNIGEALALPALEFYERFAGNRVWYFDFERQSTFIGDSQHQ